MAGTIEHHKPLPDIYSMLHQLCLQLPDHGLGILQLCFQAPILGNTEVSPAVLSLDRRVLDSVTINNTHDGPLFCSLFCNSTVHLSSLYTIHIHVLYSVPMQCIYLLCIQYTFLFCILQQYTMTSWGCTGPSSAPTGTGVYFD